MGCKHFQFHFHLDPPTAAHNLWRSIKLSKQSHQDDIEAIRQMFMEVPVSIITRIYNFTAAEARWSMSTIPRSLMSVSHKTHRSMINGHREIKQFSHTCRIKFFAQCSELWKMGINDVTDKARSHLQPIKYLREKWSSKDAALRWKTITVRMESDLC